MGRRIVIKILFNSLGEVFLADCNYTDKNYWNSKLAFFPDLHTNCEKFTIWQVEQGFSQLAVNTSQHKIYLPNRITEHELCYTMRVVIDSIQLLQSRLPFHAAAVSKGTKQYFLFANSNAGKSRIADLLCNIDDSFRLIGDDHIYVLNGRIQGNAFRRIRDATGDDVKYLANSQSATGSESMGFCFIPSKIEQFEKSISPAKWFNLLHSASAIKYTCSRFYIQSKQYSAKSLFNCSFSDIYEKALPGAFKKLVLISGSHDFAANCIRKYSDYSNNS